MSKCIICQHQESFAFTKHSYDILRCPNCDLYRTRLKTPYRQMTKKYYNRGYFTGHKTRAGYANYSEDENIIRLNAQNYLSAISSYSKGSLLDIGCAMGIFMIAAWAEGWDSCGIDVSAYAIQKARQKGVKVKRGILQKKTFKRRKFSAITLLDVFEHLNHPRQQLKIIHHLLKPNGIVIINTGDSASLLAKLEGSRWHYFIPPQHVYFYSRHNLKQLLESEGFGVLNIAHQGKWLSFRYLLHLMRTINRSSLADTLYRLVHKNRLGKLPLYINLHDNMTIIARKV